MVVSRLRLYCNKCALLGNENNNAQVVRISLFVIFIGLFQKFFGAGFSAVVVG
jgi:hypothetical protein